MNYIQDDSFFTYTNDFKEKVAEFVFEIGRHNLENIYQNNIIKQKLLMGISKLSYYTYKIFPKLEMKIGGFSL